MSLVYHCLLRYLEDQRNIVFQLSRLLSTFQFSEQRQYSNPRSPDLQPQPLDRESSLICKLFVVAHYCYYHMQYTHCITRPSQYEDLPNLNTTGNLMCDKNKNHCQEQGWLLFYSVWQWNCSPPYLQYQVKHISD